MRRFIIFFVAMLFAAALLSYMFAYSVRFTEAAVLTRFGKANEGAVKREAGLYFKLPYPIDNVTKYDTRTRVLPVKLETQQTADNRQIIVEAFCTWSVEDPLKFFQRFSNAGERAEDHYIAAETALRSSLRTAMGLASRYRMDQLFNEKANASKIPELEAAALAAFASADLKTGLSLADYGIKATSVGVSRVVLPESTTTAVFEAMKTRRERFAKETESQGQAQAQSIKSNANSESKRILAFAERRAKEIRSLGEAESVPYLKQMNSNAELAVFLSNMELLRNSFSKKTTLVLSSDTPGVAALFPNFASDLRPGEIPTLDGSRKQILGKPQSNAAEPASAPAGPGGQR